MRPSFLAATTSIGGDPMGDASGGRARSRVIAVALLAAVLLVACGGGGGDDSSSNSSTTGAGKGGTTAVKAACDLTDPQTVAAVFGGTVDGEKAGPARNCEYAVQGGAASLVNVYYYGPASDWNGIRAGYETNRGPLSQVDGVGDEAFNPGDLGRREIVVKAGDVAFAVGLGAGAAAGAEDKVQALAERIAGAVG